MCSSWKWLLIALAFSFTIVLGACGDGGGGGEGEEETPPATEVSEGGAAGGDGDEGGAAQDVSAELEELASDWVKREATITYQVSGAGLQSATLTLYWSPPDFSRIDMSMQGIDSSYIISGNTSYACTSSDGGGQCLKYSATQGAGQLPLPFLGSFTDPGKFESSVVEAFTGLDVERAERQIAGREARCYSASGNAEGRSGEVEWCFSEDGLLLLVSSSFGGSSYRMEATEVKDTVSEDDKKPPYPVQEVPGL